MAAANKRSAEIPLRLCDVYRDKESVSVLYRLLAERGRAINISHRSMPTPAQHRAFVRSRPYRAWYLLRRKPDGLCVGSVYLSRMNEIGLFIFKQYRGHGYGETAARLLMDRFPSEKRFLANINPENVRSIRFFGRLGFKHIQNTYELRPPKQGGRK